MPLTKLKIVELEQKIDWPCQLSEQFKRAFLSAGSIQSLKAGYYFLSTEDTKDGLNYLFTGSLILSIRTSDFDHFTYKLLGKDDFLYYGQFFDYRLQESIAAEVLQDCQMLKLSEQHLIRLSEQQPEFYKFMFSLLKMRTLPLLQKGLLNQKFSVAIKVAYTLLDLASKQTTPAGTMIMLEITQQQLANLSDVTRQRVNAVLKDFEKQQYIELVRGKIYIKNIAAINQLLVNENLTFYKPKLDDA
ncbi:Crp/Fnr family transcriptional regulator [Thalassotalea sp. HSM 43]|uniref:Crp/Fnr family transcriptional regulator n=1 Tax=Thalassotalea sp. HSM 43 TaxID=2552945 RepID=UPI0010808056|nr:Crp/Fnr family transcriptional regulator [Thalassotalea sp. HSM 43]QBY05136.1 Crp/Fnr family transcriptional regulator [Thalassotalea sp. HSM 43]